MKHKILGYVFLGLVFAAVVGAVYWWQNKNRLTVPIKALKQVSLSGILVPGGVECPLFKANNGTFYNLEAAGSLFDDFKKGDQVTIKGTLVEISYCMEQYPVIEVSKIQSTDQTSNWKTYRNDQYGFEFKYPANFNFYDFGLGSDGFYMFSVSLPVPGPGVPWGPKNFVDFDIFYSSTENQEAHIPKINFSNCTSIDKSSTAGFYPLKSISMENFSGCFLDKPPKEDMYARSERNIFINHNGDFIIIDIIII